MQVTRAVDYGIRALVLMARQPEGTRHFLHQLSERGDLPRNYLVKVMKSLTSKGIVRSYRGIKGGFCLGRQPGQISLRDVIEAIDGPVAILPCLAEPAANGCHFKACCAARVRFASIREDVLRQLAGSTIEELASAQAEMERDGERPRTVLHTSATGNP